ncbi:pentatricopeptide repeat-containing protein [Tanacetum coccineum]
MLKGIKEKYGCQACDLFIKEMLEKGFVPTEKQVVRLITDMCKVGDVKGALKVKSEMKLLGVTSHSVAESAIVRWLAKKGRIEETLLVFNCMLWSKIVLTTATFTTLMHSFCKKLEFQEVLKLKHIMEINHVRFDVVTYNVLIRGFCDSNDLVGALKLYREMKERGVCPTVNTFCVIIEFFCKKMISYRGIDF